MSAYVDYHNNYIDEDVQLAQTCGFFTLPPNFQVYTTECRNHA